MDERVDLVYRLLDDQLVDVEGRRCGKVNDIELSGGPGEDLVVAAVYTGRGALPARLPRPLRQLGERLFGEPTFGDNLHRIPWSEVDDITTRVTLRTNASELDLVEPDRHLETFIERLPGA